MQFKTFFLAAALMMGFASARLLGEVRINSKIIEKVVWKTNFHSLPQSKLTPRRILWSGPVELPVAWGK